MEYLGGPPFRSATVVRSWTRSDAEPVARRRYNQIHATSRRFASSACRRPKRYASAAALAEDMGEFLAGRSIRPGRWSSGAGWRQCQRPKSRLSAAIVLLAVAVATSLAAIGTHQANAPAAAQTRGRGPATGASDRGHPAGQLSSGPRAVTGPTRCWKPPGPGRRSRQIDTLRRVGVRGFNPPGPGAFAGRRGG